VGRYRAARGFGFAFGLGLLADAAFDFLLGEPEV
jgi:hypothetical protein